MAQQKNKLWYLTQVNMFKGLTESQIQQIETQTTMREARRKEVLYFPGDSGDNIYVLKRGVVKISTVSEDGREVILALLKPGEIFGEEAVVDESPRDHMAEVYDDALICVITRKMFLETLKMRPEIALKVTKLIGLRFKTFRSRLEHLLVKGAPARLAQVLLEIANEHGVPDAQGVQIPLRLSQQDLANLIGVTRESVNMALADFRRKGLVETEGRYIRLLRPSALAEIR